MATDAVEIDVTYLTPNVPLGMHTIKLTGTGADGQTRSLDWPVKVDTADAARSIPSAGPVRRTPARL